jgi:hypothetical protein
MHLDTNENHTVDSKQNAVCIESADFKCSSCNRNIVEHFTLGETECKYSFTLKPYRHWSVNSLLYLHTHLVNSIFSLFSNRDTRILQQLLSRYHLE